MKKMMIAGLGVLVLGGGAFFVVSMAGVPKKPKNMEHLRGKDEYYTSEMKTFSLPKTLANLKGTGAKNFIEVGITVEYRHGDELEDPEPLFASRVPELKDKLMILFSGKSMADVDGAASKNLIKEEVRQIVNSAVFPDQRGRVEKVLYTQFYVQ